MSVSDFTSNPTILKLVEQAGKLKNEGIRFSDIEDDEGNQYVDLVQEGGGVLGIALVGYTYILEAAGIRFFSLAGTSAGAINTIMLAGLGPINEPKSEKILQILSEKNLFDLVDGDKAIRKLIRKAALKEGGLGWTVAWNALKLYRTLKSKLGFNPGSDFENWINGELAKAGITTLKDLKALRERLPAGLHHVETGKALTDLATRLAIIATEVTTHSKVEFPAMTGLYWADADNMPPATLVRASMSIPFFFEPLEVKNIPSAGGINNKMWDNYVRYTGPVPDHIKFVDGGLLSNFPINVFHRPDGGVPRMPTFGARLSAYRMNFSETDTVFKFSGAMISSMRQIYDYDFLLRNPDYRRLICRIDADQKFNWLNFSMTRQEQVELFNLGAAKALEFLEDFDWKDYKEIRRKLSEVG